MSINNTYQTATKFTLSIDSKDLESFSSRVTDLQLPPISSPNATAPGRLQDVKEPGTGLIYDPLNLSIIADGGLSNFVLLSEWISNNPIECITRDLILTGYSNGNNVNFSVKFENAFPTNISIDQFTTTDQSDTILKFNTIFEYTRYRFL